MYSSEEQSLFFSFRGIFSTWTELSPSSLPPTSRDSLLLFNKERRLMSTVGGGGSSTGFDVLKSLLSCTPAFQPKSCLPQSCGSTFSHYTATGPSTVRRPSHLPLCLPASQRHGTLPHACRKHQSRKHVGPQSLNPAVSVAGRHTVSSQSAHSRPFAFRQCLSRQF